MCSVNSSEDEMTPKTKAKRPSLTREERQERRQQQQWDRNERRSVQRHIAAFEKHLQMFGGWLNHKHFDHLMPPYRTELVALYNVQRALKLIEWKKSGIIDQGGPRNPLSLQHSHARLTRKGERKSAVKLIKELKQKERASSKSDVYRRSAKTTLRAA
jgi:hypothetical protein